MTGPEQERPPLDLPRLEANIRTVLSADLLTPDLEWGLFMARHGCDHPAFCDLVEALRSDSLLATLDGKIMNRGLGGAGFSLRLLAFWLVSRSLRDGVQDVLASLSTWVAQDYNEGFEVVLLSGVTVKEPLSLDGGISLTPIHALPHRLLGFNFGALQDARSKLDELVVFNTPVTYSFYCLLPSAALVRPTNFRPQVLDPDKPRRIKLDGPPLQDLCWCFAALEPCWPQPHSYLTVLADSVPAADLLGGGHSQPVSHYALGRIPPPLEEEDRARAQHAFRRFNALSDRRRERLLPALEWLSMAKRRYRSEQRIIDLAIVLESLLTPEGADQIALAVRTRGAWLLGTTYQERRDVHDLINLLYDTRSKIVHTGRMPLRKGIPQWDRTRIIPDATRLCERAVNQIIEADPDWTAIVLGQYGEKNQ